MQTLKLTDELFVPLRAGDKEVTIRKGKRDIDLGLLWFEGTQDESLREQVEVVEVRYVRASGVPEDVCRIDGFSDWYDFYMGMKKFYPDLEATDTVTIIFFEA